MDNSRWLPRKRVWTLTVSQKALAEKARNDSDAGDPGRVISQLAGYVELRDATATFKNSRFAVPGASADMHGTYNLESRAVDLHGTLRTDEEFSDMTSGFKSVRAQVRVRGTEAIRRVLSPEVRWCGDAGTPDVGHVRPPGSWLGPSREESLAGQKALTYLSVVSYPLPRMVRAEAGGYAGLSENDTAR